MYHKGKGSTCNDWGNLPIHSKTYSKQGPIIDIDVRNTLQRFWSDVGLLLVACCSSHHNLCGSSVQFEKSPLTSPDWLLPS